MSETARSRAINASVREYVLFFNLCSSATMSHILTWRSIKETLKKKFARAAEDFIYRLQQIEQAIGALAGPLPVSF